MCRRASVLASLGCNVTMMHAIEDQYHDPHILPQLIYA